MGEPLNLEVQRSLWWAQAWRLPSTCVPSPDVTGRGAYLAGNGIPTQTYFVKQEDVVGSGLVLGN